MFAVSASPGVDKILGWSAETANALAASWNGAYAWWGEHNPADARRRRNHHLRGLVAAATCLLVVTAALPASAVNPVGVTLPVHEPMVAPVATPDAPIAWQTEAWRLFGPHGEYSSFRALVVCESSENPSAVGDNGSSRGLAQMAWGNLHGAHAYPVGIRVALGLPATLTKAQTIAWLEDPVNNVRAAYWTWMLRGQTWEGKGGWGCAWVTRAPKTRDTNATSPYIGPMLH